MREQFVVDLLRIEGPMSRAEIARRCSVSKPTVSTLVEHLLLAGLVVERGHDAPSNGRPGRLLAYNADAGHVIGIDVGGTTTRAVLADLEGRAVRTVREATDQTTPDALVDQLSRIVRTLATAPHRVLEVALGTPGVVDHARRRITIAPNVVALEAPDFLERLEASIGLPLTVLNDVNAATLGELREGAGADVDDLVYVSIGTGLGFGVALGRTIHRGVGGRAGELGLLPFPPAGDGTLEERLSGAAVRRRHQQAGGSGDPVDAFREAEEGRGPGVRVIGDLLGDLAWTLTLVATLLDPERIVLGGGIGLRCAPHLDTVRASVARSAGFPVDVVVARLGDDAGLVGATASALEPARSVERLLRGGPMAPAS